MSYRCLSEPTYQYLCVIVDLIALYTPFRPADDQYQDNSAQIQNNLIKTLSSILTLHQRSTFRDKSKTKNIKHTAHKYSIDPRAN